MNVQALRKADMQPSYAQEGEIVFQLQGSTRRSILTSPFFTSLSVAGSDVDHGCYGSMINCLVSCRCRKTEIVEIEREFDHLSFPLNFLCRVLSLELSDLFLVASAARTLTSKFNKEVSVSSRPLVNSLARSILDCASCSFSLSIWGGTATDSDCIL